MSGAIGEEPAGNRIADRMNSMREQMLYGAKSSEYFSTQSSLPATGECDIYLSRVIAVTEVRSLFPSRLFDG
jgi:hypothetical protein